MSLKRPPHTVRRQMRGRAFSEPVTIVRTTVAYLDFGEAFEADERITTHCATAPASGSDALVRELTEGGIALHAIRLFWTVEDLNPVTEGVSAGDILDFEGERYRVQSTQRWGGFSASVAVRQEGQYAIDYLHAAPRTGAPTVSARLATVQT